MRISEFLRASFVGAILFSPAMAQEANQVHEEALRVLREKMAQPPVGSGSSVRSIAPNPGADSEAARLRSEREARIKVEAEQRMAERERLQAERRQEFERYVKEREQLRQQQRAYDQNVARQVGQLRDTEYNEVHSKALETLRQLGSQPASSIQPAPQPQPVTAQPVPSIQPDSTQRALDIVRENKAAGAPAVGQADAVPRNLTVAAAPQLEPSNSDVHSKALEELRRQAQSGSATGPSTISTQPHTVGSTTSTPTSTPGPSPELQQRLKQIQAELEQEQLQRNNPQASAISESYVRDLERRASETLGQNNNISPAPAPAVTASPSLDPRTREIIQRQNQEISSRSVTSAPRSSTVASPRQPSSNASIQPVRTSPAAAPASHSTANDNSNVQYSRELEERARQILIERAQSQSSAPVPMTPATPSPAVVPSVSLPPSAVAPVTAVPSAPIVSTTGSNADVHARALEALNQPQQPGSTARPQPKTRQQKLKELTDLYRADAIGPAEYHQKRAQILAEPQ